MAGKDEWCAHIYSEHRPGPLTLCIDDGVQDDRSRSDEEHAYEPKVASRALASIICCAVPDTEVFPLFASSPSGKCS